MIEQEFIKIRQNVAQKLLSHISTINGEVVAIRWDALLKDISKTYDVLSHEERIQDNYMSLLIEIELTKAKSLLHKRKISSIKRKVIQNCIFVGLQNTLVNYDQYESLSKELR